MKLRTAKRILKSIALDGFRHKGSRKLGTVRAAFTRAGRLSPGWAQPIAIEGRLAYSWGEYMYSDWKRRTV